MQISAAIARLEHASALDRLAEPVRTAIRRLLPTGATRDALHGVWLGHPLHPLAVQAPIGAFLSAAALDTLPGLRRETDMLVGAGLVSSLPAVLAGAADLSETHEQQLRVGLVHVSANVAAVGLYATSLGARRRGDGGRGKALGFGGLAALTFGGLLGGHLSYRQATGVNHAEEVPHLVPPGWHELCRLDDLPDGAPRQLMLGVVPLMTLRRGSRVWVLSDRCSHLSGPLHQGSIDGECVTCPWHGSRFRLDDGAVVHGPATTPQPVLEVQVEQGEVWVRLPGAG